MKTKRVLAGAAVLLALVLGQVSAQNRNDDTGTRTLNGVVTDAGGAPAPKAVVQLKDAKTLQVRSFIAQEDGGFHFAGLSTNTDYEIKAERDGASSGTKTLSVFDGRKAATINLKLDKK